MEFKPPALSTSSSIVYRRTLETPSQMPTQMRHGSWETCMRMSRGRFGGTVPYWERGGYSNKKRTKMMNNRSQKPRVCEGLEHGAYAKDSRIEVGRWKNEELGLREMTFFNFCRFAYRGWAMSQVTTGSPGNLQAKPRPREGNLPYVTPLSPKLLRTQNALRLYSH